VIVCPPSSAALDGLAWTSAKVQSKPPTLKPFKFSKQARGSSSTPLQETLTNTTAKALTIRTVSASGDFSQNNGCMGEQLAPGASCYISVTFTPTHAGLRTGTLTITTSGPKVAASLSGTGLAPKVLSISARSQAALAQVTFAVSGYAPAPVAPVVVSFTEKLASGKKGLVLPEAAGQNSGATIAAVVPPVIDPSTGELVAGSATVSVQELLKSGTLSAKSPALKISLPATTSNLATGTVTADFLQQEQSFALQLATAVQGTQLGTAGLESSLSSIANQSGAVLALLGGVLNNGATGVQLGSVGGVNVTVGTAQLMTADDQLLGTLQTLANGSGSQSTATPRGATFGAQSVGTGCLAPEASAALSDNSAGNAAAFNTDIAKLFRDSATSPACQQPGAAEAAAGIIDGASAAALAILSQAGSKVGAVVPGQALAYADLGPAGQLIGIGVALAQTTPEALQAVVTSINNFNQAAGPQLTKVIANTQGMTLASSYDSTETTFTALAVAVQLFDGAYTGTFTGNEYFTLANCPSTVTSPIDGTLGLNAAGATITTTAPAAGSGAVDDRSGMASFTIPGLADPNATCTFNGTFAADNSGAATASGTWSCSVTGPTASGFTSANGYWSVSR
jgi:hypothetical protein